MTLSIRQIAPESKLCHELSLDLMTDVLPRARLFEILEQENALEERERKLNMCATVYILIAMSLFAEQSMTSILHSLSYGLRSVWPEEPPSVVRSSALCYRRQQLGSVPLVALMEAICQPLATPETPGAFRFLDPSSLPEQMEQLLSSMREVLVPQRHLRINARVVKRKYSPFNLKRPEHLHPPRIDKQTTFRDIVLLI